MHRTLLTTLAFSLCLACGGRRDAVPEHDQRPATDAEIYRVLLDSLRPDSRQAYVQRRYLDAFEAGDRAAALAAWVSKQPGGIDAALVVRLAAARYPGTVDQHVSRSAGLTWVDTGRVWRDSAPGTDRWRRLAFSRIVYSADSSYALVYASMWCGVLCGNASYCLLHRDKRGSWQVSATVVHLIS